MAELHVWTAWRFTCPDCGTRLAVTSCQQIHSRSVLAQRVWEHMEEAHRIIGGMQTAKLTGVGTHIILQPPAEKGWDWNRAEQLANILYGSGVITTDG